MQTIFVSAISSGDAYLGVSVDDQHLSMSDEDKRENEMNDLYSIG